MSGRTALVGRHRLRGHRRPAAHPRVRARGDVVAHLAVGFDRPRRRARRAVGPTGPTRLTVAGRAARPGPRPVRCAGHGRIDHAVRAGSRPRRGPGRAVAARSRAGRYRTATRLGDTSTSTVASMAAGEVRIAGVVEPAEVTLISALQSEPCVYYRAAVRTPDAMSLPGMATDDAEVDERAVGLPGARRLGQRPRLPARCTLGCPSPARHEGRRRARRIGHRAAAAAGPARSRGSAATTPARSRPCSRSDPPASRCTRSCARATGARAIGTTPRTASPLATRSRSSVGPCPSAISPIRPRRTWPSAAVWTPTIPRSSATSPRPARPGSSPTTRRRRGAMPRSPASASASRSARRSSTRRPTPRRSPRRDGRGPLRADVPHPADRARPRRRPGHRRCSSPTACPGDATDRHQDRFVVGSASGRSSPSARRWSSPW